MDCVFCDNFSRNQRGEDPYFVKELETGYVRMGLYQYFKGYTIFFSKLHVTELHQLPEETKNSTDIGKKLKRLDYYCISYSETTI
jgi:diadenosine tetraphosphate (Ap4A) HIT family hydrolase